MSLIIEGKGLFLIEGIFLSLMAIVSYSKLPRLPLQVSGQPSEVVRLFLFAFVQLLADWIDV